MMFNGRWVPMEMMNTIFVLWLIAAVMVVLILVWPRWRRPASRAQCEDKHRIAHGKRRRKRH